MQAVGTAPAVVTAGSSSTTTGQGPTQTSMAKAKRAAKRPRWRADPAPPAPRPCPITALPLELLAEILSHTASPKDVLALARCSLYFFRILVNNPATLYIWRAARARCKPEPLPDPTPNWSEWAYAAFVFDAGDCEMCKVRTKNAYISFCMRLRVCDEPACRERWRTDLGFASLATVDLRYSDILQWIPRAERTQDNPLLVTVSGTVSVRPSAWRDAVDEYNKAKLDPETFKTYLREKQVLADRLPTIIEHSKKLLQWQRRRDNSANLTKIANDEMSQDFAKIGGWSVSKLMRAPAYDALYRGKTNALEEITEQDFRCIKDLLDRQITDYSDRDAHRKAERAHQKRRADVKKHYERLHTAQGDPPYTDRLPIAALPPLGEFRQLPVMRVLQDTPTGSSLAKDLKHSKFVQAVLDKDLEQWRAQARAALGAVLGFADWRSASKKKIHPAERVTAWFRCKRCVRYAEGIAEARRKQGLTKEMRPLEPMDFKAACEHQCKHLNKRERKKARWSVEQFEVDQSAVDVMTQILQMVKLNPEDTDEDRTLRTTTAFRYRCKVCPSLLSMDFACLVRHSKRHTQPNFVLVSHDGSAIEHGLALELVRAQSRDAVQRASQKVYGCRHCLEVRRRAQVQNAGGEKEHRLVMKEKLFAFSGLRSHLLEKHGVVHVDDEDFFGETTEEPQVEEATASASHLET